MLAAFRVDAPMLSGRIPRHGTGWVHGTAFLLIIAGICVPADNGLVVRATEASDRSWSSVAASVLFVVFLFLPWGNAHS